MHLSLILEMTADGMGERVAVATPDDRMTHGELLERSTRASELFRSLDASAVFYLGTSHLAFPVALFGAALAGVPVVPLNYRLAAGQLDAMVAARPGAVLITEAAHPEWTSLAATFERDEFLAELAATEDQRIGVDRDPVSDDAELPAVVLYTSGTTAEPKAAVLRNRHLTAYLFGTVDFAGAGESDAALVSVPPYHVAGLANLLSNLYSGRRIVYLPDFDAVSWLDIVRTEGVTNAMVVPSMLARIVEEIPPGTDAGVPSLRSLSYGGARMPITVLEGAMSAFPGVGFVNAYGLTETSSTVALLGPADHEEAAASADPALRARLGSVGRALPGIEVEIRDEDDRPLPVGQTGSLFVRGEQVAGEYAGRSVLDEDGWFCTKDRAHLDEEGFLYLEGRSDDTIIRGGENIAPAEIEDELHRHPGVDDVAVIGVADDQWGQRLVAVVVRSEGPAEVSEDNLREWVRSRVRSSRTPDQIVFRTELPRTETGKLLRRQLVGEAVGSERSRDVRYPP